MENIGATAVINHHISDGKQGEYEAWLEEVRPLCQSSKGNIDWQIIRPIPSLTYNYTVIIRFDTIENLKLWMESVTRNQSVKKVEALFVKGDMYRINSGLDFLFLEDSHQKAPQKWKQYLVTWSAIFPLSVMFSFLLIPLFTILNIQNNKIIISLISSGIIVFTMVYILMPHYTRLIRTWLYK
jgi:hypothetical protein